MPVAKFQHTGSQTPRRTGRGKGVLDAYAVASAQMRGKRAVAIDPVELSEEELEAIASSPPAGRKWNLSDAD